MNTQILSTKDKDIKIAASILKAGGLVAIPTETVYGLAANAFCEKAVKKIFIAKGRPQDNPLIVHISSLSELSQLCADIPEYARPVIERFWPGPLTILFKKSPQVNDTVTCGLDSIAVRFPSHPVAQTIIRAAGVPLAAPSANLSGRPSTTTFNHVLEDLDGKIDAIVDGGDCQVGLESTVLDLRIRPPRILRPGGTTVEELQEVLPDLIIDPAVYHSLPPESAPPSPGMKYRHYAPKSPVVIVQGPEDRVISYIRSKAGPDCGILCYNENINLFPTGIVVAYGSRQDIANLAHNLFDRLRRFDETPVRMIFAQCPDETGIGLAISNRLNKAAGFQVIRV